MKNIKISKIKSSIQYKLFLYFIVIVIVPSITIGITTYIVSVNLIREKVANTFTQTVSFTKNEVENNLDQIRQVSDYLFANRTIKKMLDISNKTSYETIKDSEKVYEAFDNFSIAKVFRNIKAIRIYNKSSLVFSYGLDLTYSVFNDKKIIESEYFKEALQNNGDIVWAEADESFDYQGNDKDSISLFRVIKDETYSKPIGVVYISLKRDYFTESLITLKNTVGKIYLIDGHNNVMNSQYENSDNSLYSLKQNDNGIILQSKIKKTNWSIRGVISQKDLMKDTSAILWAAIATIVASLLLSCILWYLVTSSIINPIKRLTSSCQAIVQSGDLSTRIDVVGEDEVSVLSTNFNVMIDRINLLIQDIIDEQNIVKNAEYRALQAQINPHFLYNTLNSIRWMAIMQNADNIKCATESLARLLKNSTSKTSIFVTIGEEIDNLKDYIYLQKLAYINKFNVEFNVKEEVKSLYCIKFILQPIVENSIFHGIVPKEGIGTIVIHITKKDELIHFSVIDNGIGIQEENIAEVLEEKPNLLPNHSSKIGISNIHQRIKNVYGEKYGLKISSEPGIFTKVEFSIPINIGGYL